jgi:hypothetical protein
MGSALNSVVGGGGGGGIFGAIGGIVGGIFGGPIGAMIGQAIGNMLQQAVGDAVKDTVDHLQKEHGMPKFLGDLVKDKVDEVIGGLKDKNVSPEADDAAKQHFGNDMQRFQQEFQQNLTRNVLEALGGEETKGKGKGGGGGGGWLQAIAKAMGQTLGDKAAEMVRLSNKMSELNEAKGSIDKEDTQANEQNAREFNETMTKFQATGQEYSMLNNVFSTAIKALGEALSTMARKQ